MKQAGVSNSTSLDVEPIAQMIPGCKIILSDVVAHHAAFYGSTMEAAPEHNISLSQYFRAFDYLCRLDLIRREKD